MVEARDPDKRRQDLMLLYPRKVDFYIEYNWNKAESLDDGAHGMVFACLHEPT